MRRLGLIWIFVSLASLLYSQELNEIPTKHSIWYPSINLLVAKPSAEFKDAMEKNTLWGFNFDVVFRPFKNATFFQPGAQFEFLFPTNEKDRLHGAKIKTTGALIKANALTRIKFYEGSKFSPFVESGIGLNLSSTSTTTKIVDETTFFEQFFLGADDYHIETKTLTEHSYANYSAFLGVGCVINEIFSVQLKYYYGPHLEYVKKEDIVVDSEGINYKPVSSPYKTFEIAIGFSFEKSTKQTVNY